MEAPEYYPEICPTEDVQLWCTRMYLQRAIQALNEVGGIYTPTKAEQKAYDFDENIENIRKISFEIGGFFQGTKHFDVEIQNDEAHLYIQEWSLDREEKPFVMEDFICQFRELHIGEWLHKYTPERFGLSVCDGTQWSLDIEYSNGKKAAKYYGDNSYPYNFKKLLELFEIEDELD